MKPFHPILPLALLCALPPASGAIAGQRDVLLLAQAAQGDKGGEGKEDGKDKKNKGDRGKGQDRGHDGKGQDRGGDKGREGKGPDRGGDKSREGKGPDRGGDKGEERPQDFKRDNGPPQQQKVDTPKPDDKKRGDADHKGRDRSDEKKEKPSPKPGGTWGNYAKPDDSGKKQRDENKPRPGGTWGNYSKPDSSDKKDRDQDKRQPGETRDSAKPAGKPPAQEPNRNDDKGKDWSRKDSDRRDGDRRNDGDRDRDWRRDADRDRGPPGGGPDRPERGRRTEGKPPEPTEARDINDLKTKRKERSEEGGRRVIIEEPDKRRIIREGGRTIIRHDETERFRRISRDTRIEKRDGLNISVTLLPGGIRIYTDLDGDGRPLRRYRRGPDGRDIVLFDNRDYYRRSRGGSFLDAIIDLPPPRIRIPRDRYIVDYDRASFEDVYDALDDGPVDDLDRGYSLEEVRRSPMLRDRMRRIDLDTVNFDFGSWTVDYSQYGAFERLARAMNRIIDRNPGEMFFIEGHTDAVGSDEDNLSLSDRRAESVAIILTEEFGVPPENLTTQGYGEQYLKVPTDGPERLNRRVTVLRATPLLAR